MRLLVNKRIVLSIGLALLVGGVFLASSCNETPDEPYGRRDVMGSGENRRESSSVLVDSISRTLNNLPEEVVLELVPPVPILDDSTSANGKEVLAVCNVNPRVPEGGYNYLLATTGNGNFRSLGVRPGDIVRYFIKYDEESAERGIEQVTYLELPVRRLDAENPQNALIVEGGLNGPVDIPHRIEIWRFSDRRMNEIRLRLTRYIRQRRPAVAWEPSPDESALQQLVDRANQWLRNLGEDSLDWQRSELISTLPDSLQQANPIATLLEPATLRKGQFDIAEARTLQEAVWHRDVSQWAKGDEYSELEIATRLFDWTIRNIQLDDSDTPGIVHQPWQALMYGHGTARHRAWVFAELCRQQLLDVVMLAIDDGEEGDSRWWLPALVHDGSLYLFDTRLGLPIPGEEPASVATLAEVTENPELLRNLDLDSDEVYPVAAEDLESAVVQMVATPLQLSRRSVLLQDALQGEDFVVLAADTDRLREELSPLGMQVELWPFPWQSMLDERSMDVEQRQQAAQRFLIFAQRPRLWKARVLHFQGTKPIPPDQQDDPLAQPKQGHLEATQLYQHRNVRPSKSILDALDPAKQLIYRTAKADASYWLGLLSYDLGKYEVAVDWLQRRTLESFPDSTWSTGARYNLARAQEALGLLPVAIELLEEDDSPQRHGNLLRARRLKTMLEEEADTTAE